MLGDFRLDDLIGRGSAGRVYRAVQLSLNRPVAVKVLEEGLFTLDELKERFLREAEFIARLEHPNIVPVYAAGHLDNFYFFAMRLVDGPTFDELLRKGLPLRDGLRYLADVSAALAYAHSRSIVHRDVKPANIIVADGSAVLADFGLARLLDRTTITISGTPLGTPLYFSPEHALGRRATFSSDLFSVGVILYELATGRNPWDSVQSRDELLPKIARGDFPPPRSLWPDLPPAVEELILRAMRLDPKERFSSAREMQLALLALLSHSDLGPAPRPDKTPSFVVVEPSSPGPRVPASPCLPEGKPFGKYRLLDRLGKGGMGVVFKALDTELGRTVALKALLDEEAADENVLRRFQREARSAARLRHPNIVPIHEIGEVDSKHYFTMDLVEGSDLDAMVEKGPLPPKRAVEVLRDAARAVAYAHEQGIIHRDIKPSNILVDKTGRILLTDFGLAKDQSIDQTKLTMSGELLGTPAYMAPEQARGKGVAVGPQSDVYSLGAVLYHLLTGKLPFDRATPMEVLLAVIGSEPLPPRKLNPKVHPDVETICLKAMEKSPVKRYLSAAALADDCDRFLRGEPILAKPISWVERTRRRVARNPIAAGLGVLLALALVTAPILWMIARGQYESRLRAVKLAGEAKYAFATNDVETARKKADEAITMAPDHAAGYFWRARLRLHEYLQNRRLPMAILSEGLIEFSPEFPESDDERRLRAETLAELDRMKTLSRDRMEGWELPCALGILECLRGNYLEAEREIRRTLEREKDLQAQYVLALTLYFTRRFREAADVARSLLLSPQDSVARELYVRAREAEGMTLELRGADPLEIYGDALREALKLPAPMDALSEASTRVTRGVHLAGRGKPEAKEDFEEAIRLAESASRNYPIRGYVLGKARMAYGLWLASHGQSKRTEEEYAAAIDAFTQALDLDAGFVAARLSRMTAFNRRGNLHYRRGRFAPAREDLRLALEDARAILKAGPYFDAVLQTPMLEWEQDQQTARPVEERFSALEQRVTGIRNHVERHEAENPRAWCELGKLYASWADGLHNFGRSMDAPFQAALKSFSRALSLNPDYIGAFMARSSLSMTAADAALESAQRRQWYSLAVQDGERALGIHPGHPTVHGELAQTWHILARDQKLRGEDTSDSIRRALEHYQKALDSNPEDISALIQRARLRLDIANLRREAGGIKDEEFQAAMEDLNRALDINPASSDAGSVRGYLHHEWALVDWRRNRDPSVKFAHALKDFEVAIYAAPEYADHYLARSRLRGDMAMIAAQGGKDPAPLLRAALDDIAQALTINARLPDVHVRHAELLNDLAAYVPDDPTATLRDAVAAATKALELDDSRARAYSARGEAWKIQGNYERRQKRDPTKCFRQAEADLNEAVRRDERDASAVRRRAELHYSLALSAQDAKQDPRLFWGQSVADYTRHLEIQGDTHPIYFESLFWRGRAQYFWAVDRMAHHEDPCPLFEAAVNDFSGVLRSDPTNPQKLFWRGRAYVQWGLRREEDRKERLDLGVQDLSRTLEASPDHVGALDARGTAFYYLQDWKSALGDFERLFKIDGSPREHLHSLADDCRRRIGG